MSPHTPYMATVLDLARHGRNKVAPNPLVGALIVYQERIIGSGFHEQFGGPHAEVVAINSVSEKSLLPRSTLYVNLEPCCHYGKTPPCTESIIQNQISRVVIGCRDPFEQVAGGGIQALQAAGIEVIEGVLESECTFLNRRFFTYHTLKRPYVILKWAQTEDGFMARRDHSSKWISSEPSRALVHEWRAEESAIMVGTNTALYDNPLLTARGDGARNPVRVVLDRALRLPPALYLFDGSVPTFVLTSQKQPSFPSAAKVLSLKTPWFSARDILNLLYRQEILSVMVEGGARLLSTFLDEGVWDEVRVFIAPRTFQEGVSAPALPDRSLLKEKRGVDTDTLLLFERKTN